MRRRRQIFHDEYLFARPDQTEIPSSDLFDGGRILAKAAGLVAKTRVLGSLTADGQRQLVVRLARAEHREQSPIAHERIDDDNGCDKQQEQVDEPASPARARRRELPSLRSGSALRFWHVYTTEYNKLDQSTRRKTPIQ